MMTAVESDITLNKVIELVRDRVPTYYPHLAGKLVQVRVAATKERQFTTLCEFHVSAEPWPLPHRKTSAGNADGMAELPDARTVTPRMAFCLESTL